MILSNPPKIKASGVTGMENTKVVASNNDLLPMYHGTCKVFDKFLPNFKQSGALYGPGFYFTDNAEVASEYAITTAEHVEVRGDYLSEAPQRIEEMIKALDAAYQSNAISMSQYRELTSRLLGRSDTSNKTFLINSSALGLNFFHHFEIGGCQPNVWAVFLNIVNPFYIDYWYTPQEALGLIELVHGKDTQKAGVSQRFVSVKIEDKDIGISATGEIYGNVLYEALLQPWNRDSKLKLTERLIEKGIDGIHHVGGSIVGKIKHSVWIAFSPEQVLPVAALTR